MRHLILKLSQIFSEKTLLFLGTLKVDIRPNYRPNIRPFLAEYSVSADTTFCTIGRSLIGTIGTMSVLHVFFLYFFKFGHKALTVQ